MAIQPETLVIAIGGKPGEAFEPKSWESFQIAFAQAHAQGDEEARALVAEELARDPNAWQPAYNAACFEALTGTVDAAFEQLARAFALGRSACGSSLRTARISRRCDQTHAGNSYWMSEAAYRGLG